jgi:hypothetical protein
MPCAAFGALEIVLIAISIAYVFVACRLLRLGRLLEQGLAVRALSEPAPWLRRIASLQNLPPIEISRTYCGVSVGNRDVR